VIGGGPHQGASALLYRWSGGFLHTLDEVRRAFPGGVEPRQAVWIWRRILETLSLLHQSGVVHGAVLPSHLLVQRADHGVRLVGYGRAGAAGEALVTPSLALEDYYPRAARSAGRLSPLMDIQMSARCIAAVLGGDPSTGEMPGQVPEVLASLVRNVASDQPGSVAGNAWLLRQKLGAVANLVFGAPRFCPLVMPSSLERGS
jgi:hypothetical protein